MLNSEPRTPQEIAERFVEYEQAAIESFLMESLLCQYEHTICVSTPKVTYNASMFRPYYRAEEND